MRTFDQEYIRSVMTHPKVWPHISDDFSGRPADFRPQMDELIYYLAPEHGGRPVGVFMYHPHSTILYEVHTCVLPEFLGQPALLAARAGLRWMIDNTPCRKVVTQVPRGNGHALAFARRVGMVDEGTNRESIRRSGELVDQHVLGITEGEIKCLQQQ